MTLIYRIVLACTLAMSMGIGLTSCTSGRQASSASRLTTTIAPVADLIERLVGQEQEVHILLPQGNTPESYEPTPQDMIALGESDSYLYVGNLGFETAWVDRIRELYPSLRMTRLDEGLDHSLCASTAHHSPEHTHDPHYWMSFGGIQVMARNVAKALREVHPELAPRIDSAYRSLEHYLDSLRTAQGVDSMADRQRQKAFVIYHPSLSYYAEEVGMKQLVIEQDGKEPSPAQIGRLIDEAKALGVRYVFVQTEFNPSLTESIAKEIGAETIVIHPLQRDWLTELERIHRLLTDH